MKPWKKTCSLILTAAMLGGVAAAAGTVTTQMMQVSYSGIKLVVDGIEVAPKDAAGATVEPFTSNGTTYLPVRAVAGALGKDVEWDGNTMTVYIGSVPGKTENWMTKLPPYQINEGVAYDGSDHKSFFTVAGVNQTQGVTLNSNHRSWEDHVKGSALWNTNCQYTTMNLTIGHMGDQQFGATLEVYLDGIYATTYDLPWDAAPKKLSIPLNKSANVKLLLVSEATTGLYESPYGIYDISFTE